MAAENQPALALEEVVYNVALGSNMDGEKLRSRNVGDGRRITPLEDGVPCRVPNWELSFNFLFMPPIEPVMAGAVEKPNQVLHGVLWKLTREDYAILARTEGCGKSTSVYEEREVLAYPYGSEKPVKALIFALRKPEVVPPLLYPSQRYKSMMIIGAKNAQLDHEFVHHLTDMRAARRCHRVVRVISRFTLTALFWLYSYNGPLLWLRKYFKPLLARTYSRRERALRDNHHVKANFWNGVMIAVMSPFTILGFFRAVYKRRNILQMLQG